MEEEETAGDIRDEVEVIIQDLLTALQDKDTIVRWSAAKYIARIAERLPRDYSDQITDAVLELFSRDTLPSAEGEEVNISGVSEATWQGACLAIAESIRRGTSEADRLPSVMPWIVQVGQLPMSKKTWF
jgi:hypothetical protein